MKLLFISSVLAASVDAYDGLVSWSISDFVKQAKDLKVQKGEEKKNVYPQFIRKHDDDEDDKKSSGEDKEDEDKDDRSSDDEGKSEIEGICRDPKHKIDKKYCDELCNICDPSEVLCCHCLGCPDFDDADTQQQSFIRGRVGATEDFSEEGLINSCWFSRQDLANLYDYFQDENRDEVFLGCAGSLAT